MSPRGPALERLAPRAVAAALERRSVAYLPLGSLEFHGPHLPIGLDASTAHGLCLAAAEAAGGIVLPPLYQAVGGEHVDYPWTLMSSSPEAIAILLLETLVRLEALGVQRAVLLSGHFAPAQGELIDDVAARWARRGSTRMTVLARTLGQAPEPPVAPDHAGRFETLLLSAIDADLVQLGELPDPDAHPAPAGEDPFGPDRHRAGHPLHGVFGPDPRTADPALAAPLFAHLVRWIAALGQGSAEAAAD